jgi:serine/threonine protein kinase/WD40 repeat protein
MNSNLRIDTCDPDRLESFLNGDLSNDQEREFTSHLNTCENCRRSLEQRAAEPESWMEAERLLKPSHFDPLGTEAMPGVAMMNGASRQPHQIQNVLDALGPTDDPAMLGRLGGYEISGVVGAGGMGVVLKAIDKSLDRTVAIKVLAPHLASSGAARKRFAREAKAAAAVLHPNVIAIHSVSNDESLPYLVMPYVRGTSLQKRLDREGPLPLNEILRIGSQIAAGLAAAHAQGLVHRDIKPANILLEEGVERVTITDFGLARAVDDATITHSGVIAGTPQYMSPEQARGEAVEQRNDLFSLGSVLYAISTGRPPFRAETTYGVMRRITDDEPAAIREINPDIPDWLCAIIARLMSKRAADRYESAAEVTELLEACLAHVQQPAAVPLPVSLVPRVATRRWSSTPRRKGVFAMLGTLVLALVGAVCWQASAPPDIAGNWTGDDWGQVVLKKTDDSEYTGSYSDTVGKQPGEIQLKWSRIERRFNGTWREGDDRFGDISLRLVGDEIRGALTTDAKSKINPATPRLADLLWKRSDDNRGNDNQSGNSGAPQPPVNIRWQTFSAGPTKATVNQPTRKHHFATDMAVNTIAFSADGKRIAIANDSRSADLLEDKTSGAEAKWKPAVEIIDAERGNSIISLPLLTGTEEKLFAATERTLHFEVTALAFSPNDDVLAIGTNIGQVKLFSVGIREIHTLDDVRGKNADKNTPEKLKSLFRAMGSVASLAFSPDGSLLAVCGGSFADVPLTSDGIRRLGEHTTSPGRLRIWEVKTGKLKFDLAGHDNQANAVAFSPDGNLLASAGNWRDANEAGTGAIIWDARNGTQICRIRVEANGGTHSVAFSPNSKLVAIGSVIFDKDKANDAATGVVRVVHAATGITEWTQSVPGWLGPVAFTPDAKFVAVLCGGKSIRFLDTETGKEKDALRPAESAPSERWNGFAIAPTSRSLTIGGINAEADRRGFVEVWSIEGKPPGDKKTSESNSSQSPAKVSTFPLRFKLASAMADDLRQILLGRPGNEAKPSKSNQEIIVTAPLEVMNRARTFITVMDWPDRIERHPKCEYSRDSVMHAARSFFYACAIEDSEDYFSNLLSLQVLAELKGDTKSELYENYITGGTPDAAWEKSLRGDWPGKTDAIRRLVGEWNRYPLKRITEQGGVAIGFGVKHFCSVSFAGAPKDFYGITIEPGRTEHGTSQDSFYFSSLPPWWPKADVPATKAAPRESEPSQQKQ